MVNSTRSQSSPSNAKPAAMLARITQLEAALKKQQDNLRAQVSELFSETWAKHETELRKNIFAELRSEYRDELKAELESEIKEQIRAEIKDELTVGTKLMNETTQENNTKIEKTIANLKKTVDDQRADDRKNNIIISGKNLPIVQPWEKCHEIAAELISRELEIDIARQIKKSYRTGRKSPDQEDKRSIVVELLDQETKHTILRKCKEKKPQFYVNEQLTPTRSAIFFALRKAKKMEPSKISYLRSFNGNVTVYFPDNTITPNKKMIVNNKESLDNLLGKLMNIDSSNFITNWP